MIWNEVSSFDLVVLYNFADGIWTMQPNVLRVSVSNATESQRVSVEVYNDGEDEGDVVEYATDNSGNLLVNLSDIFRIKSKGDHVTIMVEQSNNSVRIDADVLGLIDPLEMIIPQAFQNEQMQSVIGIAPPTMWLTPLFGLADSVEIFVNPSITPYAEFKYRATGRPVTVPLENGDNGVTVRSDASFIHLLVYDEEQEYIQQYERSQLLCGRRYAAVEWLSRSGQIKRHTWEVFKVTDAVSSSTEYQSALGYDVSKGQEQTITLRLQGLTRYDYWYYSDIITSNDVRVALSERDVDFGEETRVNVITKKVVQPDANGSYTLSVELNFKRYDEF